MANGDKKKDEKPTMKVKILKGKNFRNPKDDQPIKDLKKDPELKEVEMTVPFDKFWIKRVNQGDAAFISGPKGFKPKKTFDLPLGVGQKPKDSKNPKK